ncbi:MAG: hypothetical protein JJU11_06860 [Candidatus Sumerlaeia bacterium]|nr:hypothetical protein [Candidatus Sumerlaeia bacterium]
MAILQVPGFFYGHLTWDERISEYIPWRLEAARIIAGGEFPFFTDRVFGGMPLFSTAYTGVLYPPNWLYLFFDPTLANWLEVFHGFLAAGGMYLYLRSHRMSPLAAYLGGGFFLLHLFIGTHAGHISMREAATFAPLVVWAARRVMVSPSGRSTLLLAGLVLLQWMIGYAQVVLYTFIWIGVDWLVSFRLRRKQYIATGLIGAGVVLGTMLAMVQILPAMAHLESSARQEMTLQNWQAGSFPPHFMVMLTQPILVELVQSHWDGVNYRGEWVTTPLPLVAMLSLVPLLGMAVFAKFRRSPRRRLVLIASGAALVMVLLAMGSYFPLNAALFHVPPFNLFRIPSRWFFLFGVFAILLAAIAVDWFGRLLWRERGALLAMSGGVLFFLTMVAWMLPLPGGMERGDIPGFLHLYITGAQDIPTRVADRLQHIGLPSFGNLMDRRELTLLVLAAAIPMILVPRKYIPWTIFPLLLLLHVHWFQVITIHGDYPSDHSIVIDPERHPLLADVDNDLITRVYSPSPDGHQPGYFALLQNTHLFHGLRGLQGYCPILSRRVVFSLNIGQTGHGWRDMDLYKNPSMLHTMAVSHIIVKERRLPPDVQHQWESTREEHFELVAEHGEYKLLGFREPTPRFQLAHEWQPINHPFEAEEDIWVPQRQPVYMAPMKLENPPWRLLPEPHVPLGGGDVTVVEEGTSRVLLDVTSDGPGVLLIRDVHWPGWRWREIRDGKPGEWNRVHRAQSILRYLPVPDGGSVIEIVYTAPKFRQGLTLSLVGLLATIFLLFAEPMKKWIQFRGRPVES